MRKSFYYSILIFIFSIMIGLYYSSQWKNNHMISGKENGNEIVKQTSFSEEKISFDAEFALKKYYHKCGHIKIFLNELPTEFINLSREEIEEKYPNWKIEEFSNKKLVLSQKIDGYCDEHYVIKLNDGIIAIYQQTQSDDFDFYKETNISSEYLTENDIQKLEQGIYVYGKNNLNLALEDFE